MMNLLLAILVVSGTSTNLDSAPDRNLETPRAIAAGGAFTLSRDVIAGGGGQASGGSFTTQTTTGQAIVGVQTGGGLRLTGGFHVPVGSSDQIFHDRFEN